MIASLLYIGLVTGFSLLSSDSKGFSADFSIEKIDTALVFEGGHRYVQLLSDELLMEGKPGEPPVYYYKLLFGLPQNGGFSVKVFPLETKTYYLNTFLAPVPQFDEDGMSERYFVSKAYNEDRFFPSLDYSVLRTGVMGGVRYAEVAVYPVRYNPARGVLKLIKRFRVQVIFEGKPEIRSVSRPHLELVKKLNFVNFNTVRNWGVAEPKLDWSDPFSVAATWVKIAVIDEGIYEIPFEDLKNLGLSPIPSDQIALFSFGGRTLPSDVDSANVGMEPVGFVLQDGGDGVFGPGDKILFYGLPMRRHQWNGTEFVYFDHPYSDTNFYWLGLYSEPGIGRIVAPQSLSGGVNVDTAVRFYRHEQNLFNIAQKGLWWLGEMIQRDAGERMASMDFDFDLPGIVGTHGTFEIQVVSGGKYQNRNVRIVVNGDTLGLLSMAGLMSRQLVVDYDGFRETNNRLSLIVEVSPYDTLWHNNSDYVFLDYFDVKYTAHSTSQINGDVYWEGDSLDATLQVASDISMVWDVSNPLLPEVMNVSNGSFSVELRPGSVLYLHKDTRRPVYMQIFPVRHLREMDVSGVRYLAIVPSVFGPIFGEYARWRADNILLPDGNGHWRHGRGEVLTVTVEDIFDEFGFGVRDPVAIRNFVRYVYDNDDSLLYLALVGDGHYDYKGYTTTFGNFIPPYEPYYLLNIESQLGANDLFFANMDGDLYPDIFIGRIPVRYRRELSDYIQKLRIYESGDATGLWRDRVLLVADDEYGENQTIGGDTQHMYYINLIYNNWIPHSMDVSHVYEIEFPRPAPRVRQGASEAFIREFNRGASMVVIFIHGHPAQLSHEKLFDLQRDAEKINAGRKNPFVFVASCKVGGFDRIKYPRSITEDWTLRPGGAIATVSSTVGEFHSTNMRVFEGMVRTLQSDSAAHPSGEMLFNGVAASGGIYFVLFGDPSIAYSFVYPEYDVSMPDTIRGGEQVSWHVAGVDTPQTDFVYVNALGPRKNVTYHSPDGVTVINYTRPPAPYFVGKSTVMNDSAAGSFWIPISVDTGSASNTIIYNPSGVFGMAGMADNRVIIPGNRVIIDTMGATVELIYKGRKLVSGDTIRNNIPVEIRVSDRLGINLSHEVRANEPGLSLWYSLSSTPVDLTYLFEYDLDSDTSGSAYYVLDFGHDGEQTLTIREYDAYGNAFSKMWRFYVVGEDRLSLENLLVYPNPVVGDGAIRIGFNLSVEATVDVSIWTISGRRIWDSHKLVLGPGYNEVIWNGRDMDGEMPSNGLYFVTIEAEANGIRKTYVQRFAIAR